MGLSATLSGGADPHWRPGRNRLALALTAGLHLLIVLFWLQQRAPAPATDAAPRMVTILLQPRAPERPRAPVRVPAPQHMPKPAHAVTAASPPAPSAPVLPAPPAPPPAPVQSGTDPLALPPDAAALARDPALSAKGSFTLGLAKSEAGRIDHELRGGKSGVPLEADTPWARFQRGLEAAHVEPSYSAHLDSYTSPDGVVIYRERVGGRVVCRRTGSVGLGVAGAVGVNDAGPIRCPSGVTWKREY